MYPCCEYSYYRGNAVKKIDSVVIKLWVIIQYEVKNKTEKITPRGFVDNTMVPELEITF